MKTEFIYNFLSGEKIGFEKFASHIDFNYISGSFVKNNRHNNEIQFGYNPTSGNFIFSEYSPGVFTSCYKYSNLSGSGLYDGETALKLNKNFNSGNVTILINYINNVNNYKNTNVSGKSKILLDISSDPDNADAFSYSIGLTDNNNFIIEYSGRKSGVTEYKKNFVYDILPSNNIACVSFKDNYINFYQIDINTNFYDLNSISLARNLNNLDKSIYIGNKLNYKKDIHTGFSGIIKDLVLIEQNLDQNQLISLGKIIAQTGSISSGYYLNSNPYKIFYSGKINPTGIIGTGIVEYTRVLKDTFNINCQENQNCNIYVLSGVTGLITGYKIEYSNETEYSGDFITEKMYPIYDQNIFGNYSNFDIKKLLSNNSAYEIQTYGFYLDKNIYSGNIVDTVYNSLNYIFYDGKIVGDFISGQNYVSISGAQGNIYVNNAEIPYMNGKYLSSGIYNYSLYSNGIPLPVTKRTLYVSSLYNKSVIRWTNNSGWVMVNDNIPIYRSIQNVSTPNLATSWSGYSGYFNIPNVVMSYGYINRINQSNVKSLYFKNYSIAAYAQDPLIDLSSFSRYSVFVDGLKLFENKDYYKVDNSIYFSNIINNKNLLIIEDFYSQRITGDINNMPYDLNIEPNKHLLWINGILQYEGLNYKILNYDKNERYLNNINQNNIEILNI